MNSLWSNNKGGSNAYSVQCDLFFHSFQLRLVEITAAKPMNTDDHLYIVNEVVKYDMVKHSPSASNRLQ